MFLTQTNLAEIPAYCEMIRFFETVNFSWSRNVLLALDLIHSIDFAMPDNKPCPQWDLTIASTLEDAKSISIAENRSVKNLLLTESYFAFLNAVIEAKRGAAWVAIGKGFHIDKLENCLPRSVASNAEQFLRVYLFSAIASDLKIESKHIRRINQYMMVWRKGYCLRGDFNGIFYVYAQSLSTC